MCDVNDLFEKLKKIKGISKPLIEKALNLNNNDIDKTFNTLSEITGHRIQNAINSLEIIITDPNEEYSSYDEEEEECCCNKPNCSYCTDSVEYLRKNKSFLKFRDDITQQESQEEINLMLEEILKKNSYKFLENIVSNQAASLDLLSGNRKKLT